MEDFDQISELQEASFACNNAARHFIGWFSQEPESVGWPPAQWAKLAVEQIADIGEALSRWHGSIKAMSWVQIGLVRLGLPVFEVDGQTYSTAHEAAKALAMHVVDIWRHNAPAKDGEGCCDLASAMAEVAESLTNLPDLNGYIERESLAAAAEATFLQEDDRPDTTNAILSGGSAPSLDARALAAFIEHPDWNNKQIAKAVDANAKSLTQERCPKFHAAKKAHRQIAAPRGSKDRDGNVEAWDEG